MFFLIWSLIVHYEMVFYMFAIGSQQGSNFLKRMASFTFSLISGWIGSGLSNRTLSQRSLVHRITTPRCQCTYSQSKENSHMQRKCVTRVRKAPFRGSSPFNLFELSSDYNHGRLIHGLFVFRIYCIYLSIRCCY